MIDLKKRVVVSLQELYILHALHPPLTGKSRIASVCVSHGLIKHPGVSRFDLPIMDAGMPGYGRIRIIGNDVDRQQAESGIVGYHRMTEPSGDLCFSRVKPGFSGRASRSLAEGAPVEDLGEAFAHIEDGRSHYCWYVTVMLAVE